MERHAEGAEELYKQYFPLTATDFFWAMGQVCGRGVPSSILTLIISLSPPPTTSLPPQRFSHVPSPPTLDCHSCRSWTSATIRWVKQWVGHALPPRLLVHIAMAPHHRLVPITQS